MCFQNLPVRAGVGTAAVQPLQSPRVPIPRMEDHKAQYRAKYGAEVPPVVQAAARGRDQSEDRKLPPYFTVPVDNPSGVRPGMYYAVFRRSTMERVSVWSVSNLTAAKWADEWPEIYPDDKAGDVVNPESANMVWEWPDTEADNYVYHG